MHDYHKASTIENRRPTAVPWQMYLIIGIAGIFITTIMGYGFYASSRINATDVPLVNSAMKVKLEAADKKAPKQRLDPDTLRKIREEIYGITEAA